MPTNLCLQDSIPPPFVSNGCEPETHLGQIEWLYIKPVGSSAWPSGVGASTEFTTRLAASDTTSIKALRVIGSRPAPSAGTSVELPGGLKTIPSKEFTLSARMFEAGQVNHDAVRTHELTSGSYEMAYATRDGLFFTVPTTVSFNINMDVPESYDEFITFPVECTWKSRQTEARVPHPLDS